MPKKKVSRRNASIELPGNDIFLCGGTEQQKSAADMEQISVWLDSQVLAKLREAGSGWESQINSMLRKTFGFSAHMQSSSGLAPSMFPAPFPGPLDAEFSVVAEQINHEMVHVRVIGVDEFTASKLEQAILFAEWLDVTEGEELSDSEPHAYDAEGE